MLEYDHPHTYTYIRAGMLHVHIIEQFSHLMLEAEHGAAALAGVAVVLDGVHDVLVPPAVVRDPVPDTIIENFINMIS
jgi:hypothetical protein